MLGVASDNYASILYPLVESCLPTDILRVWERNLSSFSLNSNEENRESDNKLDCLMKFLRLEIESEEKVRLAKSGFRLDSQNKVSSTTPARRERIPPSAAELFNSTESKTDDTRTACVFCDKSHYSSECKQARNMTYEERKDILFRKGACFKCLKTKHVSRFCKAKVNCSTCGKGHFGIMCTGKKSPNMPDNSSATEHVEGKCKTDCTLTNKTCMRNVLLQTLVVRLRGNNTEKYVRILIDSGSQRSYVTKYAASVMGYRSIKEEQIVHSLFGGIESVENHNRYLIRLSNLDDSYRCSLEALDQKNICSDISRIPFGSFMKEVKKHRIFLTDMMNATDNLLYEFSPFEIHVLIGADVAGKLFTGKIKQLNCGLVCMETRLGWTIMGKTNEYETKDSTNMVMSLHVNEAKIADLWRLDTLGILDPGEKKSREDEDLATKEHFIRSIKLDEDGRYEVSLPWIQGHPPLPSCRSVAEWRLKNCVDSLKKMGKLEAYESVLDEWQEEGIIEEIDPTNEVESEHYLPHRAVVKENSTTKVRPVFDGSAREKDSPSINDCLEKGPNIVELIPSVINRFRLKKIGVTADIKKAFLQIGLNEWDRPYLRFLWWENGDSQKLKVFQHRRVVFGISCSPYLLGATLEYHLKNAPEHLQRTASNLLESFYVDNCVTSVDNDEELDKFIAESKSILSSVKFDLRGWEHSQRCQRDNPVSFLEEKDVPVLGLTWKLKDDSLTVDLREIPDDDRTVTKRNILSAVHKIFDPIGFTCPVTLGAKVLLQECWKSKVTWDEELPISIAKKFERWKKQLSKLKDIAIPRCLILDTNASNILTLHVFCDASKTAYATCIFLRSENEDSISCQLVQARCRVAPMKSISIPRLELLACSIGARLVQSVKTDLSMENTPTFFWSDSGNALYWIKKNENWTPFVYNRVREIRSLSSPENWNYIPGLLNPADLPSRGCNAEALAECRWWEGPEWLTKPFDEWPKSEAFPDFEIIDSEKRKSVISAANTENQTDRIYDRISSYNRLVRVIAWIHRFLANSKVNRANRTSGILTREDLMKAEISLMRIIQRESLLGPEDKRLKGFLTLVDSNGLLRVKTRILMREDTTNFRFPILLPYDHPVVEKLIRSRHTSLGHAGVQTLMSNLREEFWILKFRKTVRKIIRTCVRCKRYSDRPREAPMAALPENRVKEAAVFEIVGMDYAGPLILRGGQKAWIVIYTCAIFRAVHLELATALSTENFLQTLRRFIARRGRPAIVYSDNGSNFTGAENLLKNIDWNLISQHSIANKISWKFIPPSAPWWERIIGMIKGILRRVLGRSSLNLEEMNTIICDTESIINSRLLTYVSDNVDALTPLAPSMFLQELKETGTPDLDNLDASSFNKRHAYRQKLKEDLRRRFRSEYLGHLRQSSKRTKLQKPIEIGDIVLVSSDNTKRIDWPLARVIGVYPSKDGHIRLAKIRMKSGEFLRPTLKL